VFTGQFDYNVDEKGRLSIPSRMRTFIDEQPSLLFVAPGRNESLNAYTKEGFRRAVDHLQSQSGPIAARILAEFSSKSEACPMDKQGRIVLSPRLRDTAGIGKEVVVRGVIDRIEIWDKKKFEADQKENLKATREALDNFDGPAGLF